MTMRMLRKFWRNEQGSIPIEGVYGTLLLLSWFIVAFQVYDAFRTRSMALRASYTVGDLISRERNAIGPAYVDGLKRVFDFITRANAGNTWLRVTLISCSAASDTKSCNGSSKKFSLTSSYSTAQAGGIKKHTATTINQEAARIPVLAAGDMAVVVESSQRYYPLFVMGDSSFRTGGSTAFTTMGLSENLRFSNFVVTRPRGPRTVWDDAN